MPASSLILGRLGAPRGIKGDVKLQSYSGEFDHILKLKTMELRGQGRVLRLKVVRTFVAADGATIAFEGYESPEAARVLTGLEIVAARSEAAPLGENEWYVADLVGLELRGPSGTDLETSVLAKVASIVEGGADPWLEALLPDGKRALVPFRKEFVGRVDVAAGYIELLAPWLLE